MAAVARGRIFALRTEEVTSRRNGRQKYLSGHDAVNRGFCVGLGFSRHFRPVGDAFGKDKIHVGNTDKTKEHFQVSAIKSVGCLYGYRRDWREPPRVYRLPDLPGLFRYSESDTGAGNQIKVVFQLRRDIENCTSAPQ
ncbi:Uncharacterised protein [Salmonella enterica subsp. enterica]|uniref:Uncharacterized protein n=1 Tax=Salmonella enterica I TaxID=59201 RepID=A0A379WTQ6_SALET|nr:Uncharacterised protein [Salmonella enterica subsp. enterica]